MKKECGTGLSIAAVVAIAAAGFGLGACGEGPARYVCEPNAHGEPLTCTANEACVLQRPDGIPVFRCLPDHGCEDPAFYCPGTTRADEVWCAPFMWRVYDEEGSHDGGSGDGGTSEPGDFVSATSVTCPSM